MTSRRHKGDRVTNYLDNLLPDDGEVTREWARIHGAKSARPFDLLWHVGADCAGAASFFPHDTDPSEAGALPSGRARRVHADPGGPLLDERARGVVRRSPQDAWVRELIAGGPCPRPDLRCLPAHTLTARDTAR